MNLKYKLEKSLIKFQTNFIINKQKRKQKREELLTKLKNKTYKTIKWGVSYCVFDGLELLEHSIKQIRNEVDYINVVYSDVSYRGERKNEKIHDFIKQLEGGG